MSTESSIPSVSSKEQLQDLVQKSQTVIAYFYSESNVAAQQLAPILDKLLKTLQQSDIALVKISHDDNEDIASEYEVSKVPTFLIFRNGQVSKRLQGSSPQEIYNNIVALKDVLAGTDGSSSGEGGASWVGAELPKGYGDLTDQVEPSGCELLNADEDAGPVKVLFGGSKPSALGNGKASGKDWVQSGADDQLLLYIPFQSTIKLHTLQFTSIPPTDEDDAPSRPSVIQLYLNKPQNIDFDEAEELEPTQTITIDPKDWNKDGTANIPLRFVKFQKTSTLIIFVQKGDGEAETVRLDRVKIIGEAGAKREMGQLRKMGEDDD